MVAFSFFAVALFCSLIKSGTSWNETMSAVDTVKWLCENYQYANAREFTKKEEKGGSAIYYCQLTFYYAEKENKEEEAATVCRYHYPAVVHEAYFGQKATKNHLFCKYEIQYLCAPGKIPIGDLCVEFNKEPLTLAAAKKKCEKQSGFLPDSKFGREFITQLINTANPRRFGMNVPKIWYIEDSKKYQAVLVRGLDSDLPGTRIPVTKNSGAASYACVYYGLKTYRIYQDECKIYREQFKLTAQFHQGSCYAMSTSVYAKAKAHDLHQYCHWLSDDDRVVTPVSGIRRDGIDKALEATIFEYNYVLTTGEKKKDIGGRPEDHWKVVDLDPSKNIDIFQGVWFRGRPVAETDGTQNLQAIAVPKLNRGGEGILADVPKYFRGHPVCALGVTPNDNAFKKCDEGWQSVTRDNGRVMCAKAFTTELRDKTYPQSMDFCKKYGAVLAPMSSPEEQNLIFSLMDAAKVENDGTLWLGATRNPKNKNQFIWALDDDQPIEEWSVFWNTNEPNNKGGHEDCLQVFTGGVRHRPRGKWNDIPCDFVRPGDGYGLKGGVCAKYHSLE